MSKFYPEPYEPFGGDINLTADLSNYATKTDLKNVTHVDTSGFDTPTVHDKLFAKVNNIDTGDFVLKAKYDTDKTELQPKKSLM